MNTRFLSSTAILTIAACSNATAPNDAPVVEDIIGIVSSQRAPYFDGNMMRVTVTKLRVAPSSNQSPELSVWVDPSTVVRVAAHGCDVRGGSRNEIVSGVDISVRLKRAPSTVAGTYQAAHVTISY